jgi:hydroxymethylbilane synthase
MTEVRRRAPVPERTLRIATRGSPLALAQAGAVAGRLARAGGVADTELVVVRTTGDLQGDVPIERISGQGVFVKEVQLAVLDGRADLAVHSAKDLPADTPGGLVLACVPERADPRDALVGCTLHELPPGALVATGSVRRRAQLAWLRPDLTFAELRGNVRTRVERARSAGAGVLAFCALRRLGLDDQVDDVLDTGSMLPQVAQGALAVECREDDDELREMLTGLDDAGAHGAVIAERSYLRALGGGCTLPVGALAVADPDDGGRLRMEAMLATGDGRVLLRAQATGDDPVELGGSLAAVLLDDAGGRALHEWSELAGSP